MRVSKAYKPKKGEQIERYLLNGILTDPVEIAEVVRVSVGYVRTIKRDLQRCGQLAGKNVG